MRSFTNYIIEAVNRHRCGLILATQKKNKKTEIRCNKTFIPGVNQS